MARTWKRLKGKNPQGKNFRKLLRRKLSSAMISKISRNTIKSSKGDIFYLLRNIFCEHFLLPRSFQKFLPFAFLPSGSFRRTAFLQNWGDFPENVAPPPTCYRSLSGPMCPGSVPEGSGTPLRTLPWTPPFSGTPSGTLPGHFEPEGPERLLKQVGGLQ